MFEAEDEGDEVTLPGPQRVAQRALVLAAVSCRAWLERDRANPGAEDFHQRLRRWLEAAALAPEFKPAEWELVHTPLGLLESRREVNASWRAEGLGVLAWRSAGTIYPVTRSRSTRQRSGRPWAS
jgi:hypothetical protein